MFFHVCIILYRYLDHLVAMFGPHLMDTKLSYNAQTDVNLQVLIDFISGNRSGIASSTLYSAGGYVASSLAKRNGESDWPDIQFVLVGGSMSDQFVAKMVSDRCNVKPGLLEELFAPAYRSNVHSFTLAPVLVRPKSKGTLRLAGRDPKLRPLIDPNYLANSDDVKIIVEGNLSCFIRETGTGLLTCTIISYNQVYAFLQVYKLL